MNKSPRPTTSIILILIVSLGCVCISVRGHAITALGDGAWGGDFPVPVTAGGADAAASWNGNLVVGGHVVAAGSMVTPGLASWDGVNWSDIGGGVDGSVRGFAVFEEDLIVGGWFDHAGGIEAGNVARWDGVQWHAFGAGLDGWVSALAVYSGKLYASGNFQLSGLAGVNYVARWNGSAWVGLGSGVHGELGEDGQEEANVRVMAATPQGLCVGGDFTTAGGSPAMNIACWNGTDWISLGLGVDGYIRAMREFDGELVIAGSLNFAGGSPVDALAKWNGVGWSGLNGHGLTQAEQLAVIGTDLYVYSVDWEYLQPSVSTWNGSTWTLLPEVLSEGLITAHSGYIHLLGYPDSHLLWTGTMWQENRGPGIVGYLKHIVEYDGKIVAAGEFSFGNEDPKWRIASWDGLAWTDLAIHLDTFGFDVAELLVYEGDLIAVGDFDVIGGVPAQNAARWDGMGWAPLGAGLSNNGSAGTGIVRSATTWELAGTGMLVVGGRFNQAGSVAAGDLAAWDGVSWTGLDTGGPYVESLAAVGSYLMAASEEVPGFVAATEDGSTWTPLGDGPDEQVLSLEAESDALLAITETRLLRWKDNVWTPVASELAFPVVPVEPGGIDSPAPAPPYLRHVIAGDGWIVATGTFGVIDGVSASGVAVHDGDNWWPLGSGGITAGGATLDLARFGAGFMMSGGFSIVGDAVHYRMATYNLNPISGAPLGLPRLPSMLLQNHPNPFNPQTMIAFDLPKQEAVRLAVYDVSGRLVDVLLDNEIAAQGRNEVVWRGRDMAGRVVSAGVYFYRLEAGEYSETKRMVLIK